MDIMSLDYLAQEIGGPIPPFRGIGGIPVEPVGFIMMNVKVPCVQGYDEDQVAIVMDDPDMSDCPVILGTPTIYHAMEVIKESEISKLAVPWASSRVSWLMRDIQARLGQVVMNDVANKQILPLNVDEVVGGGGGIALRELALRARLLQSPKDALVNADLNRVT